MADSFLPGFSYAPETQNDGFSYDVGPENQDGFSYAPNGPSGPNTVDEYRNALKARTIEINGGPSNMEEFSFLNPQATKAELTAFSSQLREKALIESEARNTAHLERLAGSSRTGAEILQDTAISLIGKGSIGLGEVAYGAADLVSRINPMRYGVNKASSMLGFTDENTNLIPSVDEAFGLSSNFAKSRDILNSYQSDNLQANRELANRRISGMEKEAQKNVEELVQNGWSEGMATLYEQAKTFGKAAGDYATNPALLADEVFASAPNSLLGGAVGSQVIKAGIKKKLSKEAIEKSAGTAGVLTTAATEGLSNAVSAQGEILSKYSDEDTAEALLGSSDMYRKLVQEDGLTHKQAIREMANRGFDIAGSISAVLGGIASKGSGAGSFIGNITNEATSGSGNILKRVAGKATEGAVTESLEESVQSGAGQYGSNLAKQQTVDNKQSLSENVGSSAGIGAAVGGAQSGAIGAVKGIQKSDKQKEQEASERAAKQIEHEKSTNGTTGVKKAADELVKEINEENPASVSKYIMDPSHALYDAEVALAVSTHADIKESKPEEIKQHRETLFNAITELTSSTEVLAAEELKSLNRKLDILTDTTKAVPDTKVEYGADAVENLTKAVEAGDKPGIVKYGAEIKKNLLTKQKDLINTEVVASETAPESIKEVVKVVEDENDARTPRGLNKLLRAISVGLNKENQDPAEIKKLVFYGKNRLSYINGIIEANNESIEEELKAYNSEQDPKKKEFIGDLIKDLRVKNQEFIAVASKYDALMTEKGKDVSISKEDIAAIAAKYSSPAAITDELFNQPEELAKAQAEVVGAIEQLDLDGSNVSDEQLEQLAAAGDKLKIPPAPAAKAKIELLARKLDTTLKDVSNDIRNGGVSKDGRTFKGVKQYFSDVRKSLDARNTAATIRQMKAFDKFRKGKEQRAKAFRKAFMEAKSTGREVDVVGQYRADGKTLNTVTGGSEGLVKAAERDAALLNKSYAELNKVISEFKKTLADEGVDLTDDTKATKAKVKTKPATKEEQVVTKEKAFQDEVASLFNEEVVEPTAPPSEAVVSNNDPEVDELVSLFTGTGPKEAAPVEEPKVRLEGSGRQGTSNLKKDQAKSDKATKFIGFGRNNSSTAQYAEAWGKVGKANTGKYTEEDTVFVSTNGGARGPSKANFKATTQELDKAMEAGATILTDTAEVRTNGYNDKGEGEVAKYLAANGYAEVDGNGVWSPQVNAVPEAQVDTAVSDTIEDVVVEEDESLGLVDKLTTAPIEEIEAAIAKNPSSFSEADIKYLKTNPIKENFSIKPKTILGKMKNTISQLWKMSNEEIKSLYPEDADSFPIDSDVALVRGFAQFGVDFITAFNRINNGNKTKIEVFKTFLPIHHFLDKNGKLPSEVLNALAIGAFDWAAARGADTLTPTRRSVASFLGIDEANLMGWQYAKFAGVIGQQTDDVVQAIGRTVYNNLGLTQTKGGANLEQKLITSLGLEALNALIEMGVVSKVTTPIKTILEAGGQSGRYILAGGEVHLNNGPNKKPTRVKDADNKAVVTSIRLNETDIGVMANNLQAEASRAFSDLAGTTREGALVSINKPAGKLVSDRVRNSDGQRAPARMLENAKKDANTAQYINVNMNKILNVFSELGLQKLLGGGDVSANIVSEQDTIEGRNIGIKANLRRINKFRTRMLATAQAMSLKSGVLPDITQIPIYFPVFFGKQLRQTITTTDLNPSLYKLDRYLVSPSEVEVKFNDPHKMGLFAFAVGQGLGVKTDKIDLKESIKQFYALFDDPTISAGIEIAEIIIGGQTNLSAAQENALIAAVNKGGEGVISLKAIMSLAEYTIARSDPSNKSFKTSITYEVDGLTNGPANAIMQLGLISDNPDDVADVIKQLNRAGFMTDSAYASYQEFASDPVNLDNYQNTATKAAGLLQENVKAILEDPSTPVWVAEGVQEIINIMGPLRDSSGKVRSIWRNLLKNPITVTFYGSGERSIKQKVVEFFFDEISSKLNSYHLMSKKEFQANQKEYAEFMRQVGKLFDIKYSPDNLPAPGAVLLDQRAYNKLAHIVTDSIGNAVVDAINSEFATALKGARLISAAGNAIFYIFNEKYQEAITKARKEAIENGELSKFEDLPKAMKRKIKKDLIDIAPIFKTMFSASREEGIFVASTTRETSRNELLFGVRSTTKQDNLVSRVNGKENLYDSPGAATMSMLVQGTGDAATMGITGGNGLNVYDARIFGLDQVEKGGQALNQAQFEISQFNMMAEVASVMGAAYGSLDSVSKMSQENFEGLLDTLSRLYPDGYKQKKALPSSRAWVTAHLEKLNNAVNAHAEAVTAGKKAFLSGDLMVSQFVSMVPGIQVNNGKPSTSAPLKTTRAQIRGVMESAVSDMAESLIDNPGSKKQKVIHVSRTPTNTTPVQEAGNIPQDETMHGTDTTSPIYQLLEGSLVDGTGRVNVHDVIQTIGKNTKSPLYKALAVSMLKLLPKDFEVIAFTNNSATGSLPVHINGTTTSLFQYEGMYDVSGLIAGDGVAALYLNIDEGGATHETILHELIHAVTVRTLNQYGANPKSLPPHIRGAVEGILRLRAQMMNLGADKIAELGLTYGLNTQDPLGVEFVATGLTSAPYIQALENTTLVAQVKEILSGLFNYVMQLIGLPTKYTTAFHELVYNVGIVASWESQQFFQPTKPVQPTASIAPVAQMSAVEEQVASMTPEDLFNSLGSASKAETEMLRKVFNRLHDKLLKGLSGSPALVRPPMSNHDHLIMDRLDPEITDDADHLISNGFNMSKQAAFVFKAHMIAYSSIIKDFNFNSKEIMREYLNAQAKLTPKDLMNNPNEPEGTVAYFDDLAVAEHKYEALFGINRPNDFLGAFLALSQTNQNFRNVLKKVTPAKATKKDVIQRDLLKTIQILIDGLINFFNSAVSAGNYSGNTQNKIDTLLKNIQHVERVAGSRIVNEAAKTAKWAGDGFTKANNKVRQSVSAALNSKAARNSKDFLGNNFVNTVAQVIRKGALIGLNEERATALFEAIEDMQAGITKGKHTVADSIYDELTGGRKNKKPIHRLLGLKNALIGQARSRAEYAIKETLRSSFLKEISEEQDHALKLIMNADLSELYAEGYDVTDIATLLSDSTELQKRIVAVSKQLQDTLPSNSSSQRDLNYYLENAEALGIFMVHNRAVKPGVMVNAGLIARRATDPTYTASPSEIVQVTPLINELASLYAIKHAPVSTKDILAKLMTEEAGRTDGDANSNNNGITTAFSVHNVAKKNALVKAFHGDELHVMKGYSKDTYDSFTAVKYGTKKVEAAMRRRGYTLGPKMPPVPGEKDLGLYMYISHDGGDAGYLQSVMSLTDMVMQGTARGTSDTSESLPVYDLVTGGKTVSNYRKNMLNSLNTKGNLSNLTDSHLLPVFDSDGKMVGLRMVVPNVLKDKYMGRNNAFLDDMARTVSHTEEKVNTQKVNKLLVDAMVDVYTEDKKTGNLSGYVYVGAESPDPRLREIYHIMPEQARQDMTAAFGSKFPIRKDLVDVAFGYREPSLTELFGDPESARKGVAKLVVDVVTNLFGKDVGYYVRKGEVGLQELVKLSKDITVIRSVVVLAGNIISNNTELVINQGMNPVAAARLQWKGFLAARAYQTTQKELSVLKLKAAASNDRNSKKRMTIRIEELENQLERNPVGDLVKAGLMSSIVEGEEIGGYSFNPHGLLGKAETFMGKVPTVITTPLKYALMSKGTPMYDFLHTSTMLSDFASRYALYEHTTKKGMDKQDAIDLITETFINYDVPTHRMLQWADSVGMIRFMKYYMRVQRVIMRGVREHPGRLLMFALAQNWLGVDVASPNDAFILTNDVTNKLGTLDNLSAGFEAHGIFQL